MPRAPVIFAAPRARSQRLRGIRDGWNGLIRPSQSAAQSGVCRAQRDPLVGRDVGALCMEEQPGTACFRSSYCRGVRDDQRLTKRRLDPRTGNGRLVSVSSRRGIFVYRRRMLGRSRRQAVMPRVREALRAPPRAPPGRRADPPSSPACDGLLRVSVSGARRARRGGGMPFDQTSGLARRTSSVTEFWASDRRAVRAVIVELPFLEPAIMTSSCCRCGVRPWLRATSSLLRRKARNASQNSATSSASSPRRSTMSPVSHARRTRSTWKRVTPRSCSEIGHG